MTFQADADPLSPDSQPSDEEKTRSKRIHARVMLACGIFISASAFAATYLAFSRPGSFPTGLLATGRGVFSNNAGYHLSVQPREGRRHSLRTAEEQGMVIAWEEWNPAAFQRAAKEDRLVLMHLCAFGSHGCHLLEEVTYADPKVAEWVASQVVPARADPQARPDLARIYQSRGWPLTALLLPSGELLSSGGFIPPSRFLPWAERVVASYRNNPDSIREARERVRREAAERRRFLLEAGAPKLGVQEPGKLPANLNPRMPDERGRGVRRKNSPGSAVSGLLRRLEAEVDVKHGGFGKGKKLPLPAVHRFLAEHHRLTRDSRSLRLLSSALDGVARLMDPVWGGVYRAANATDWSDPEYEKLLSVQAAAIEDFARSYVLTRNPNHRRAAERIAEYVERFLKVPGQLPGAASGGYFAGQDADMRLKNGGWMEGAKYFRLAGMERAKLGSPSLDPPIYAAANADLVLAYLTAGRAFNRPELVRNALSTLDFLWREAVRPDGAARHFVREDLLAGSDREMKTDAKHVRSMQKSSLSASRFASVSGKSETPFPNEWSVRLEGFIEDQLALARAETAALHATGNRKHLARARRVLQFIMRRLSDSSTGGLLVLPKTAMNFIPGKNSGAVETPDEERFDPVDPDGAAAVALIFRDLYENTADPADLREFQRLSAWALARPMALDPVAYARLVLAQ